MSCSPNLGDAYVMILLLIPASVVVGTFAAVASSAGRGWIGFIMGSGGFLMLLLGFLTAWDPIAYYWYQGSLGPVTGVIFFLCSIAPLPYFIFDAKSTGQKRAGIYARIALAVAMFFLIVSLVGAWAAQRLDEAGVERHCFKAGGEPPSLLLVFFPGDAFRVASSSGSYSQS